MQITTCTLPLYLFSSIAWGLWINPGLDSGRLAKRTDPTLLHGRIGGHNPGYQPDVLLKRTDPTFLDGDFGKNFDGEDKKELLQDAIQDVYLLVRTTLKNWDDNIFDHWFPPSAKDEVHAVFSAVIKDPDVDPDELEGADILQRFKISPTDFQAGKDPDLCEQGADAYTSNQPGDEDSPEYSETYFCDIAFGTEENDQPPTLDNIDCDNFKFGKRYRITNEMEALTATVLHEMMHFNSIGTNAGLEKPDEMGSLISDIAGTAPQKDIGEPYWSWVLRKEVEPVYKAVCIRNADNYVWFALETYWTAQCKDELAGQGKRFDPPVKPKDD